jgi:hypothetical protein
MAQPLPPLNQEMLDLYVDLVYSKSQPNLLCPPTLDALLLINPAGNLFRD